MTPYANITRDDSEWQLLDLEHNEKYDGWKAKEVEAISLIRLSCCPDVRRIVRCIRNPHQMRNVLETSHDTAGSYIGRQDIFRQFCVSRPKQDELHESYFTKLTVTALGKEEGT